MTISSFSQSGTTQTVVISGATISLVTPSGINQPYFVTFTSGKVCIIGVTQPMRIDGTGTGADFNFSLSTSQTFGLQQMGFSRIASATTSSPYTITLTAPFSGTFSASSGTLTNGHGYDCTVNVPGRGLTIGLCNGLNHYEFLEGPAAATDTIVNTPPSESDVVNSFVRASNVTTATLNANFENAGIGDYLTISGSADTSFNYTSASPRQILTITRTAPFTITYNDTGANASESGCTNNKCGTAFTFGWPTKFGDPISGPYCNTAQQLQNLWQSWGMNTLFEDLSNTDWFSFNGNCQNNLPVLMELGPGTETPFIIEYASDNLSGSSDQPMHEILHAIDQTISTATFSIPHPLVDTADPRLITFPVAHFGNGAEVYPNMAMSAREIATPAGDSDNFGNTNGGGFFPGVNGGTLNGEGPGAGWSAGFITAIGPAHESAAVSTHGTGSGFIYGSGPYLYPIDTIYSKTLSAVAPSGCFAAVSLATPSGNPVGPTQPICGSWPDWERNWYGTCAAMNAAYGTSFDSVKCFGTTETAHTGETLTVDGAAHTLANSNVTPLTLHVFINTTVGGPYFVAGDCRVGSPSCTGTAGQDNLVAPSAFTPSATVPANLAMVDSNNNIEIALTAGKMGAAPTWPTGTNCNGNPANAETTSNVVTLLCVGPKITGTVTIATGSYTFTAANSFPAGETATLSYTTGGWGASPEGTGLEDEDGRDIAITGNNPICLIKPPAWSPNTQYTAYNPYTSEISDSGTGNWWLAIKAHTSGTTNPFVAGGIGTITPDGNWVSLGVPVCDAATGVFRAAINANQAWAKDVLNYEGYGSSAILFFGMNRVINILEPGVPDFGPNFSLESYLDPMIPQSLQSQAFFMDGGYSGGEIGLCLSTDFPLCSTVMSFIETYFNKPYASEFFNQVSPGGDWPVTNGCSIVTFCQANTTARMNHWHDVVNNGLMFASPGGLHQFAGANWWGNVGFQGKSFGFSLRSGNDEDGTENVTATVACSAPLQAFTCGGEVAGAAWLNTDVIHSAKGMKATLALWLGGTAPPTTPTSIVVRQPGLSLHYPLLF